MSTDKKKRYFERIIKTKKRYLSLTFFWPLFLMTRLRSFCHNVFSWALKTRHNPRLSHNLANVISQIFHSFLLKIRAQFHHRSTYSFYRRRSQKGKKTLMAYLYFLCFWDPRVQKLYVERWWNWHLHASDIVIFHRTCSYFFKYKNFSMKYV